MPELGIVSEPAMGFYYFIKPLELTVGLPIFVAQEIVTIFDNDNSGTVTFDEFCGLLGCPR